MYCFMYPKNIRNPCYSTPVRIESLTPERLLCSLVAIMDSCSFITINFYQMFLLYRSLDWVILTDQILDTVWEWSWLTDWLSVLILRGRVAKQLNRMWPEKSWASIHSNQMDCLKHQKSFSWNPFCRWTLMEEASKKQVTISSWTMPEHGIIV